MNGPDVLGGRGRGRVCHAVWVGALLLGHIAGCGEAATTLEGTVTVDGKPAPAGIALQFVPLTPGTPAYAVTDAQGHYEALLTFRTRGIATGAHRVRLMPGTGATSRPPREPTGRQAPPEARPFPEQAYQEIETIDVRPGRNRHDIALPTGG